MNEKGLIVLEQYDLNVKNARRGRGSYLVETDKGLKILTEFSGTEGRLAFQDGVMQQLREQGFDRLDLAVKSKEGLFIVKDREENAYVLRDWYEGRECDAGNLSDVQEAVRTLAALHRCFRFPKGEEGGSYGELSLKEEYARKNALLRRIRKFVRSRSCKNEFEQEFLKYFEEFYEEARKAESAASTREAERLFERSREEGCLCHGDYNQHHILLSAEGTAVTEFGHCHYGIQIGDLSQFFRKILEKQNWDKIYGNAMLREYGRIRPLSAEEMENLRIRLMYPEKFWKLANHYYGSSKSWQPAKNAEKLKGLAAQQSEKAAFLKMLE